MEAFFRASSMFTSLKAEASALILTVSGGTPAALTTLVRFSSFTGLPSLCSRRAAWTYSKSNRCLQFWSAYLRFREWGVKTLKSAAGIEVNGRREEDQGGHGT